MKQGIHPKYHDQVTVTCTCGNTFITGSTLPEIKVEICAACHPFYTGEVKFIDLAGRVDKFAAKREQAQKLSQKKSTKKKTATPQTHTEPQTLQEMLKGAKKSIAKQESSKTNSKAH